MPKWIPLALIAATVLIPPALAYGQPALPPGNSGVDQYTEGITTGGGELPSAAQGAETSATSTLSDGADSGSLPATGFDLLFLVLLGLSLLAAGLLLLVRRRRRDDPVA